MVCLFNSGAIKAGYEMIPSDELYAKYRDRAIPVDDALKLSFTFAQAAVEHFRMVLREHPRDGVEEETNQELIRSDASDLAVKKFSNAYMAFLSESGALKI